MRSRSQGKKGFTIVELVIVIAVIAILAGVLIPTFIGLTKKANNSADMQMVTNINKQLAAAELLEGKNVTMHDAVMDAASAGYNLTALLSANNSENTILWSQDKDRFIVINDSDKGKVIAGEDEFGYKSIEKFVDEGKGKKTDLWTVKADANSEYSVYYCGDDHADITTAVGFDAGDKAVNVTYTGNADVIIRTNIGKNGDSLIGNLKVETAEGSVTHYGMVNELTVEKAKTYTECGYVYVITKAWNGTLKANGAQFHQPAETDGESGAITVTGVKDLVKVDGTASYLVHYNANGGTQCDFCLESMCEHNMSDPIVVSATCETDGTSFSQCDKCHHVEYIVTPKFGHDWKELEKIAATCTTAGQDDGRVCLRCGKQERGGVLMPLFHDFVDGKCTRCKLTDDEYFNKAIKVTNDDIANGTVDFHGLDKRKDLITIVLQGDVTVTADKFCEVFGTPEVAYWLEKKSETEGEVGGTESIVQKCNGNGLYAVDLILNGYTLTVNSSSSKIGSEYGIEAYGHFKITGRDNNAETDTNKLVLNGKTILYNSLIHAAAGGSAITFDSINVVSDYPPIFAAYMTTGTTDVNGETLRVIPNKITILNSKLEVRNNVSTTMGQDFKIYFDFTKVDPNSGDVDLKYISDHYLSGLNCDNGVISDGKAKYNISFYIKNADGDFVKLEQQNYFAAGWPWFDLDFTENEYYYMVIYTCKSDILDENGEAVTIKIDAEKEWVHFLDDLSEDETFEATKEEYVKIENSPITE